jgi:hypothetical protein
MIETQLSPKMAAAMRAAEMDNDGELHVGWKGYVPVSTVSALRSRGLINDRDQFTAEGRRWFNANVT